MAGRGTDIKLGHKVKELGGLYVLGTEKHENRRIDNQLRGRSGRQGDVGAFSIHDFIRKMIDENDMVVTRLKRKLRNLHMLQNQSQLMD